MQFKSPIFTFYLTQFEFVWRFLDKLTLAEILNKGLLKMEETKISKLSAILNADFSEEDTIWLTNGKTLRKTIGVLGMALPFLLLLSLYIFTTFGRPLE